MRYTTKRAIIHAKQNIRLFIRSHKYIAVSAVHSKTIRNIKHAIISTLNVQ